MKDPETIEIAGPGGGSFIANRYIIENGPDKQVMIYWYQGRGRKEASEYRDKINTVWDSVLRRRNLMARWSRAMTGVGEDEQARFERRSIYRQRWRNSCHRMCRSRIRFFCNSTASML